MNATQLQLFYQEQHKISELDKEFLELVKDGLTKEDLKLNILRRPGLWGRYENWLNVLP